MKFSKQYGLNITKKKNSPANQMYVIQITCQLFRIIIIAARLPKYKKRRKEEKNGSS